MNWEQMLDEALDAGPSRPEAEEGADWAIMLDQALDETPAFATEEYAEGEVVKGESFSEQEIAEEERRKAWENLRGEILMPHIKDERSLMQAPGGFMGQAQIRERPGKTLAQRDEENEQARQLQQYYDEHPEEAPRQYANWVDEFGRNLASGTLNVASGISGTLAAVSQDALFDHKLLEAASWQMREWAQEGPLRASEGKTIPGYVAMAAGQALPYMAAAALAAKTGGALFPNYAAFAQSVGAFGVGFAVEGDNAYKDWIEAGGSEEGAEMARFVVGGINGMIEQLQVKQLFKFAKSGPGSPAAVAKRASESVLSRIKGTVSYKTLKHMLTEGVEEALQETTSIVAQSYVEPQDIYESLQRIGLSGLGGATVGGLLGWGGAVKFKIQTKLGQTAEADANKAVQKIQARAEKADKAHPEWTDEQKAAELDTIIKDELPEMAGFMEERKAAIEAEEAVEGEGEAELGARIGPEVPFAVVEYTKAGERLGTVDEFETQERAEAMVDAKMTSLGKRETVFRVEQEGKALEPEVDEEGFVEFLSATPEGQRERVAQQVKRMQQRGELEQQISNIPWARESVEQTIAKEESPEVSEKRARKFVGDEYYDKVVEQFKEISKSLGREVRPVFKEQGSLTIDWAKRRFRVRLSKDGAQDPRVLAEEYYHIVYELMKTRKPDAAAAFEHWRGIVVEHGLDPTMLPTEIFAKLMTIERLEPGYTHMPSEVVRAAGELFSSSAESLSEEEFDRIVENLGLVAKGDVAKSIEPGRRKTKRKYVIKKKTTKKSQIARATGMEAQERLVPETEALKGREKAAVQAAAQAHKAAIAEAKVKLDQYKNKVKFDNKIRAELRKMVQKYLPMEERGRMLTAVETAKSGKSFAKGLERLAKYVEAADKKRAIGRLKKFSSQMKKRHGRKGGGFKLLPRYEERMMAILDSFTVATPSTDKQMDIAALRELTKEAEERATAQELTNPYIAYGFDAALAKTDAVLKTQGIRGLDAGAIDKIADAILLTEFGHKMERMLINKDKSEKHEDARTKAIGEVENAWGPGIKEGEVIDTGDLPKNEAWYSGLFGRKHANIDTLSRVISGMKEGKVWEYIYKGLRDGRKDQYSHLRLMSQYVQLRMQQEGVSDKDLSEISRMAKRISPTTQRLIDKAKGKRKVPGDTISVEVKLDNTDAPVVMSVGELMDIYMHTKNPDNYKALTGEQGFSLHGKITLAELTDNDAEILVKELDKYPKAKKVADIMAEALDYQQSQVNIVSMDIVGYEIAQVANYWHIKRKVPKSLKGSGQEFAVETIESRSHWKERTGGPHPLIIGDALKSFHDSIAVGAEYIGMAAPMRNANMMISDKELQDAVRKKGYEKELDTIIRIINRATSTRKEISWLEKAVGKWTRSVTRSIFGLNPRLAVQQYFSVFLLANEVDKKHLKAIRFRENKSILAEIEEYSSPLWHRFQGHIGRELGDAMQTGAVMQFFTGKEAYINKPTFLVRKFDRLAIMDVWRVAKSEVEAREGAPSKGSFAYWEAVSLRAEELVTRTQPTWDPLDRSEIGGTTQPLVKAITMFHSQREKLVQMMMSSRYTYLNSSRTKKDFGRVVRTYGLVAANLAMVAAWKNIWDRLIMRKEKDYKDFITDTLVSVPGMFYFAGPMARDVSQALVRQARGRKPYTIGDVQLPAFRIPQMVSLASYEFGKYLIMTQNPDADAEDMAKQLNKAFGRAFEASNYVYGLPLLEINKIRKAWLTEQE